MGFRLADPAAAEAPPPEPTPATSRFRVAAPEPPADPNRILGVLPGGAPISADQLDTARFAGERALNAAASVPGLPADIQALMAQYIPEGADAALGMLGAPIKIERERQRRAKATADTLDDMVPLGGENIREALQDYNLLPKPREARGVGERWLGNVADFAGSMFTPGGIAKALIPGKGGWATLGGATGLTGAQEVGAPGWVQFLSALVGGGAPAAVNAAKSGAAALKPALRSAVDPLTAGGRETLAGELMLRSGAKPKPDDQLITAPTEGVNLTAGQAMNDTSLLGLQKMHESKAAAGAGDMYVPFKERPAEVNTILRTALEELRTSDLPAEAKLFAEAKLQEAERAMTETLEVISPRVAQASSPGVAQAQSSTAARERIGAIREKMRKQETELFEKGWAKEAMVDAAAVKGILDDWLSGQPVAFQNKLPPEVKATLARLLPEEEAGALDNIEVIRHPPAGGERIVAAASRDGGKVYQGQDHSAAIEQIAAETGIPFDDVAGRVDKGEIVEGFVTSSGRFVTRSEAAKIAAAQGQIDEASKFPKGGRIPLMTEAMKPGQTTGTAVASPLGQMIERAKSERTESAFNRQFVAEKEAGEGAASTMVPLAEINPVKTMLREASQKAYKAGDFNDSRIYGELGDTLEKYLDDYMQSLPDDGLRADRNRAIEFSRQRAALFDRVPEMRALFGRDIKGGAHQSPEEALDAFITKGGVGQSSINKLLAVDPSPEMQGLVRDSLLAGMPQKAADAQKYLQKYDAALSQIPVIKNQLRQVADRMAATEALRQSPLGMLAQTTPEGLVKDIVGSPNAVELAQNLQRQMVNNPAAWNGMRTSYVDHILNMVENLRVQDSAGRSVVRAFELQKFNKANEKLNRIFLGPEGAKTLKDIERSAFLAEQTGKFAGSTTAPLQASDRFIDELSRGLLFNRLPLAIAAPLRLVYGGAQEHVKALLAQALLDPKMANDLMRKADARGLAAMNPTTRTWLEALTPGRGVADRVQKAARGTIAAGQSQQEQPSPAMRGTIDGASATGIGDSPFTLTPAEGPVDAGEPRSWLAGQ